MYVLQEKPDKEAVTENGSKIFPVATLKDEYGGISHIATDDHCYVLFNGSQKSEGHGEIFVAVKHWYKEAVEALKLLPALN